MKTARPLHTFLTLIAASIPIGLVVTVSRPAAVDSLPLLLILDSSGSMNESDGAGGTKLAAAKASLHALVDQVPARTTVGLRVFGHRIASSDKANACKDTELVVPVAPLDSTAMNTAIDSFAAKGETPIGLSLQQAADDLGGKSGNAVLVSDGQDECFPNLGPDPCTVAKDLSQRGIDLTVNVVGFRTSAAANTQLKCIADATKGTFVEANSAAELTAQLTKVSVRDAQRFTDGSSLPGGPSVAQATQIPSTGTYLDTIVTGESRWWKVNVPLGSKIAVSATVEPTDSSASRFLYAYLKVMPKIGEARGVSE